MKKKLSLASPACGRGFPAGAGKGALAGKSTLSLTLSHQWEREQTQACSALFAEQKSVARRHIFKAIQFLLLFLSCAAHAQTPSLPTGLSFIAQNSAGTWGLYWVDKTHTLQTLKTQFEPRQACVSPQGPQAVYASADASLRRVDAAGSETELVHATLQHSYTQPCMSLDASEVYAVQMQDGKSVETDLLRFAAKHKEPQHMARQPGAQHDPFVHQKRWLVYASVGCSDGCEELLVEIWLRDFLSNKARQLSLLNALSQNPVTDGQRVVFSSNASGTHQLWQVSTQGQGQRQLTHGPTQATTPALCAGEIYFVRTDSEKSTLARLTQNGKVVELPLPHLTTLRNLRCLS
jgi:hypothetical protein